MHHYSIEFRSALRVQWASLFLCLSAFAQSRVPRLPQLGDFDRNGQVNWTDGSSYLKAYGLSFATYGVTDDIALGLGLPRRTSYDWHIQTINDQNLRTRFSISDPEVVPLNRLPNFAGMVSEYLNLPQQYLRELGRRRFSIQFFGDIGRLTKAWGGNARNIYHQMKFFPQHGGLGAVYRYQSSGSLTPWEVLSDVKFDRVTGNLQFHRPLSSGVKQRWQGRLDTSGENISGRFSQDDMPGQSFPWDATHEPEGGGTTLSDGLPAKEGWVIGDLGPIIVFKAEESAFNFVHEIGHTVWDRIAARDLSFQDTDRDDMLRVFTSGPNGREGSGFITDYAATGAGEDFAETFAYYYVTPSELFRRAVNEPLLSKKLTFIRNVVDIPDPGPAAAPLPNNFQGLQLVAMSRKNIRFKKGSQEARDLPGVSISRIQPTAVTCDNKVRLFAVGLDGHVYFREIRTETETITAWIGLPERTRLPVAALFNWDTRQTWVFSVADDNQVHYRMLQPDGSSGVGGVVQGFRTWQPVGAGIHRGKIHLFAADVQNQLNFTKGDTGSTPTFGAWEMVPGAMRVRSGVTVQPVMASNPEVLRIVGLNGSFRVVFQELTGSPNANVQSVFNPTWREERSRSIVAALPVVTSDGFLYVKGFGDGKIYRKRFESTDAFERLDDL